MQPISFKREVLNVLLRVGAVVFTIVLLIIVVNFSYSSFGMISDGECNIAVMPIEGVILPFSGITATDELYITPATVRSFIKTADEELGIEGIMFEINSPGGTPVAAETIAEDIKSSSLPTVALIGDIGASGGYMVASAADTIIASNMSEVGSIGVTMSYVEESTKNMEDGLTFVSLSTGKYKDAGNPNKPLTAEERELFERDLTSIHNTFVEIVANNRNLSIEEVSALADGSTMLGSRALEAKLIDRIGGRFEAKKAFAEKLGKEESEIIFCEYSPMLQLL
ncbi:signal peptide peptidase SppA [Candidatus Kaiserbacteria bacterium CG_4_9_14_0_2_um_filter_41_32]|uniref:Signal peptide peptidase SppA n=1 Tax=Candidatus Kaiserbacteria bacterium CG_4_9_14_0_2_um_filter_41_32 TaxID=1974601 RepID=A0A2M8FFJ7_9BACT|nr:MAG: signal peptide peptidase SppA [Candidatus Kaiserbacteria bacterium CG_4_9_14_0_2_um_filter_41_32]